MSHCSTCFASNSSGSSSKSWNHSMSGWILAIESRSATYFSSSHRCQRRRRNAVESSLEALSIRKEICLQFAPMSLLVTYPFELTWQRLIAALRIASGRSNSCMSSRGRTPRQVAQSSYLRCIPTRSPRDQAKTEQAPLAALPEKVIHKASPY